MTTQHEQGVDELLAEYRKRREEIGELRRKIGETSGSATAPRQVVKVTVGPQGEVRSVEFPTSAYKRMAPAELAKTLMTTIGEARQKALTALGDLMNPKLPQGMNVIDLLQGKTDMSAAWPENPKMPDMVREFLDRDRGQRRNGG